MSIANNDHRSGNGHPHHGSARARRATRATWPAIAFISLAIACCLLLLPSIGFATDEENCLMCHKYAGLGRYAKDETKKKAVKRVFYVNEELFRASYHGKLRCKSCHQGVEEIPHTDVKRVDCSTECHLKDPSTGRDFSHRPIVEDLAESIHGAKGSDTEHPEDLPNCKDCHSNKPYQSSMQEEVKSMRFLKVCLECHESKEWADRFYRHMLYRASTRRPSKQIIALCSKCHADPEKMKRHELDVVAGFKDTFHGKAILYGNEEVANCLNCHAPYDMGFSPHRIKSRHDTDSPANPQHKLETCEQVGCHTGAREAFADMGKVHPSSIRATIFASKGRDEGEEADIDEMEQAAEFQAMVLYWIKMFYKVLIILVVGGLGTHRILDLFATRREQKKGGH